MSEEQREDIINHSPASSYVPPSEPEVQRRLEWFQDQKLAFMVHWGAYSQLGICESWPISDGDADWSRVGLDWEPDAQKFRQQYFDLNKTFNPVRYQPEKWAAFIKQAGFRYVIFPAKHHDGFCMFDTKYSDYRVTAPDCPFHTHRYANILKHAFDACRAQGLGIGVYFSKPDWHIPSYWAPGQEHPIAHTRNTTYDPLAKPALWEQFVQYTHNQIMELVEGYGPIDILWLDGGWVCAQNRQDIRLGEVVDRARKIRPGLLCADRTVGGPYENYITPEQQIPKQVIPVPWESCVTVGTSFSYAFEDEYKSPRTLVHMVIDVVSKGGNLALNIGTQPDGRLPRRAMEPALAMGTWLEANGEAIYGTRICEPYVSGAWSFTRNQHSRFALYRCAQDETLPPRLTIPVSWQAKAVECVDGGQRLSFQQDANGITVELNEALAGASPLALALRIR